MKQLLFSILFLLLLKPIFGCSYIPYSFCHNAIYWQQDNVLLVKPISQLPFGIRAEVIEVLRGAEARDTINIWSSVFFCMEYDTLNMNDFTQNIIGDTFLVRLPLIDSIIEQWENIGYYRYPGIDQSDLLFSNDSLYGFIAGSAFAPAANRVIKMDYQTFKGLWLTNNLKCDTIVGSVGIHENDNKNSGVKIFPTPSYSIITISSTHEIHSAEIFAVNGKSILKSENKTIDVSALKNGLYFLKIEDERGRITFEKLVKQ